MKSARNTEVHFSVCLNGLELEIKVLIGETVLTIDNTSEDPFRTLNEILHDALLHHTQREFRKGQFAACRKIMNKKVSRNTFYRKRCFTNIQSKF